MSKNQPAVSLIHVPDRFSVVEPGVYRSASPSAMQVPFLASLQLRTIISLTPEFPARQLIAFTRASGIDFLHYGTTLWRPSLDWKPITDDIVKATLETVLDVRNHPLLLIDPWRYKVEVEDKLISRLGIHQTGCVMGALRMMQGWNFASALVEYQSHSGQSKHRIADEHYIELFEPDLVNLPPPQFLPHWFHPAEMEEDADSFGIWEGEGEEFDYDEESGGMSDGGPARGVDGPDEGQMQMRVADGDKQQAEGMGESGEGRDPGATGSGVG